MGSFLFFDMKLVNGDFPPLPGNSPALTRQFVEPDTVVFEG